MSDWQEKFETQRSVADTKARAWLDPKCERKGKCSGVECYRGYKILESDKQGPVLVSTWSMHEDSPYVWRRVMVDAKSKEFLMELEDTNGQAKS